MRNSEVLITNYHNDISFEEEQRLAKSREVVCRIDLVINRTVRTAASIKRELRDWDGVRKLPNIILTVHILSDKDWNKWKVGTYKLNSI